MGVTLRDVARHAGVSFKTVSNVINDRPHVAPKTSDKVWASIEALQYRPNQAARSLRHGRSGYLALAIPELAAPYFSSLASEVSQAAKATGRTVVVEETMGDVRQELQALDELTTKLVDGVIFSPLSTPAEVISEHLGTTPLVMLGEQRRPDAIDYVAMDSVRAAQAVTEHLLAIGRRRIAVIGYFSGTGTGAQRWQGYHRALQAAGLPVPADLAVEITAYRRQDGAEAAAALIESGAEFDALLCFNDLLALGALRELHDRGIAVPEQVALAGFDDIEDGRFSLPRLTTVAPDVTFLAQEAVRLLVRRIEEPDSAPQQIDVPFTIQVRASTMP